MIFTATKLEGVYIVDLERFEDSRGFFARTWCAREFEENGLNPSACQANMSFNRKAGTMRGVHFQSPPHQEAKLVRCIRGAIFDVAVDLRPDSPTRNQWVGVELNPDNRRALLVAEGCGHAFQTLVDDSEVFYIVSQFYAPDADSGAHYADPAFAIEWPHEITEVSEKDLSWPYVGAQ